MRKGTVILCLVVLTPSLALVSGCADPKKVGVSQANVQAEFIAMKAVGEKERGGYKLISLQELKAKLDAKEDVLVVDTMPYEASYKKQHIPTAVQFEFPIPEMETMDDRMERQYRALLMWAVKLGYTNVYRCLGGIRGWKEAGYPVRAAI